MISRRFALLMPLLLASCGDEQAPPATRRDFPPLRYGYLPPISLTVQRVEMAEGFVPASGEGEIGPASPIDLASTLFALARDRLKPVTAGGVATFRIVTASIVRRRDGLVGTLAVRIDVRDADNTRSGFAEARVTATKSGATPDPRAAVYDLAKSLMDDMNVELEFQLRSKLRDWVAEPASDPAPKPPEPPVAPPLPPPPPPPPRI